MKVTDIELLIGSAYSGLAPSPAVEEAVRAALPAERARPVRRGRSALVAVVALIVAVAALARSRRAAEGLADGGDVPELPVVARPGAVLDPGEERVRIRLTGDGRILVAPEGEEWHQVTLAELGPCLKRAAESFDDRERARGRSGYEQPRPGVRASLLRVELVADRNAPWKHLQWLMLVCVEQGMARVAFAVRDGGGDFALDAALPVDRGLGDEPGKVSILIRGGERPRYKAVVGGFAFDGQEAEDLVSVARYLVTARDAATAKGLAFRGEVKAGFGVPYHLVAGLLAEFRRAGYEHVDFYGTAIPGDEERKAIRLPLPAADRGAEAGPGGNAGPGGRSEKEPPPEGGR